MNQKTDIITVQPSQVDTSETGLAEYVTICRRRWWLIAIITAGFAVAAATWSFLQIPIYQAKATVVIDQDGSRNYEKDKYYPTDTSPDYFQTHFELMKSHYVLQRAAQLLNLSQQSEYKWINSPRQQTVFPIRLQGILDFLEPKADRAQSSAEDQEDAVVKNFGSHVEVMPIRGARLAYITVSSIDPKFAALAANTLTSVYIERTQELKSLSSKKAAQWFTDHLDDLRKKVEASEQALYRFRSKHGLLGGQEQQAVAAHATTELDSELVKAEMKKADAKTRYQQIEAVLHRRSENGEIDWSHLDAASEVLNSSLIQTLRAQEIRVSGQVAELSDKYGPLHPKMARAKAELQDLHERIQHEVQKIYDSIKHEYEVSSARERAIQQTVSRHRADKVKVGQYEIEHGILEREAQSSQHLYDIFLKVAKEADLSSGMKADTVVLADPAVPNSTPVKPKTKLNTMLGLLIGLMTGFGAALVLEFRDRSLKGPEDVERYLPSISLFGVVPRLPKAAPSQRALVSSTQDLGLAAESFRTIRTSLLFSSPGQLPSCVLITSPGESEGKTTLAVNLAIAMAQLEDTQVLLIDADLRQPNPHPIYAIHTGNGKPKGLADYLAGRAELQSIVHQTEVPNLSVIPRGECPRNPSELLHSKHMSTLLKWFREKRLHIIVDSPPVLPVADPSVLAPQVDGVLLAVSAGETTREACRLAIQRLTGAGGNLLGVVLQNVRATDFPYYSNHYGVPR